MEKYGTKNHMQSKDFIRDTFEQVFMKKYGVKNPQQIASVKAKTVATCLKRYGVDNPGKLPQALKGRHDALVRNAEQMTSKPEDILYGQLRETFGQQAIVRQKMIEFTKGKFWFIDFYIKPIDTYIQFDGLFYHGLDRPIEEIKRLGQSKPLFKNIARAHTKDKAQNTWFKNRNMKLLRITDKQFFSSNFNLHKFLQ